MQTPDGTSQDTGSEGLTLESAAERIASLLPGDGDGEGDETPEAQASTDADEEEGDEPDAEDAEDQSDEDEETEDSDTATQTFTLKVDGEEVKVTLDELTKGYSRQADYTRKTMALADERKTLDTEKATTSQEREAYRQALTKLEAFFATSEDDAEELQQLRHSDPAEYAARIAEKQDRQRHADALKAEQSRLAQQAEQEEAQQRAAYVLAEEAKLLEALPEWKDKAKRDAEQAQLIDYALSAGLTPEEVSQITDHRLVLTLRKAAKWDALQAKKPAVQAKVEAVKAAKPGSAAQQPSKVTELTRAKQRLAKSGSVDDAAAAILLRLG